MVSERVWINDDTLRTCGDLDDLDEYVVATVVAKRGGRTVCRVNGIYTCSELYHELNSMCGDVYDGFVDNVGYEMSSQDEETFSKYVAARFHEALESPLEDSTFTRSAMANETSTTESEETTLSDDVDDTLDVDAVTRTTLTTTGTTTPFSDTGTTADDYGDPPSLNVVDEPESRTLFEYAPSDETQMPNSGELTLPRVMDPPLQRGDFTNHLLCSGTQRGTQPDCFYPAVGHEFDFDNPSDFYLGDGTRRPISDIDGDRLSTVNSLHSLDPNRLGKFQIISFNTLGSLVSSITSPGQPSDLFWKYSMTNGQMGSWDGAPAVGTRGLITSGKKGLEYFDATRPPGAAAA